MGQPHAALAGVRVVDLSRLAPGPFCTMLLGDFGADVVRVERPSDALERPRSAAEVAFDALGRNKRSVVVDLKQESGRAVLLRLVAGADVLVEGFRAGVTQRLGIDYPSLRAINPRLVYCSLTGYGQTGPYAAQAGHDINFIALGGLLAVCRSESGEAVPPLNLVGDFAGGGLLAAFSIVTALLARQRTGVGQHIDLAMADGTLSLLSQLASQWFRLRQDPSPLQELLTGHPGYAVYRCADGKELAVGALEPHLFTNLCRAVGLDDLAAQQGDRAAYPAAREQLRRRFLERPRAEWMELLLRADTCVMPVHTLESAHQDPHFNARGMFWHKTHDALGDVEQLAPAPKLSATPAQFARFAPRAGEHTDEVLGEAGYSEAEVTALRQSGAVG